MLPYTTSKLYHVLPALSPRKFSMAVEESNQDDEQVVLMSKRRLLTISENRTTPASVAGAPLMYYAHLSPIHTVRNYRLDVHFQVNKNAE